MRCILIFDHLNDLIFSKYDKKFSSHIKKLAQDQGLVIENEEDNDVSVRNNTLMQLFAPVITSQQIMTSQFGNSYTSIQCSDGHTMVFDEYMGYLFIQIGYGEVSELKRVLSTCICIVQHLCGPDVPELKVDPKRSAMVSHLLDTWISMRNKDQACLVEAVEQLTVNTKLSATLIKTLREAVLKLKSKLDNPMCHAIIFVQNKFLSLYSSRDALDLAPSDLFFLNILMESYQRFPLPVTEDDGGQESDLTDNTKSFSDDPYHSFIEPNATFNQDFIVLPGNGSYRPHAVHTSTLSDRVTLLLLYQTSSESLCGGLHDAFSALVSLHNIQMSENSEEGLRHILEMLDTSMKQIFESLKKNKRHNTPQVETVVKQIHLKWDQLKKKFQEVLKDKEAALGLDPLSANLQTQLKLLLRLTSLDRSGLVKGLEAAELVTQQVQASLTDFTEFFKEKATHNFSIGSRTSLTINKYLEEFPGLVHFMHIDRTNHRITAPSLDFSSEETVLLTKNKIWAMVNLTQNYLQEGYIDVMWKDTTFHYAYYLWFEDSAATPIKPKISPAVVVKTLPPPGIFFGDFYRNLVEACFPKAIAKKVRCYELYCIHLGLTTSACVLEHSRRLAATIFEVTGQPNPLDGL